MQFLYFSVAFSGLYNVIDSFIVGNVNGENALAAISVTGPIVFMFIGLLLGISAGFGIKCLIFTVLKSMIYWENIMQCQCFYHLFLGISMSIILILNKFILNFINTPKNIFNQTYLYCNNILKINNFYNVL